MARYRKIDTRIWNDEKFRGLSDRGKMAFFFLLTHPHLTALGAMRATVSGLASELGWAEKAFREAFEEIFQKGMVKHDASASCIVIPNFLRYNGPESPNVVKSWAAALDLIPECALRSELIRRVKAFTEVLPEAFREALPEAFWKGMPNPEQEPEQEKPPRSLALARGVPFEVFWEAYPKKRGDKDKAQERWARVAQNGMGEKILADISRRKREDEEWIRENGRFVP